MSRTTRYSAFLPETFPGALEPGRLSDTPVRQGFQVRHDAAGLLKGLAHCLADGAVVPALQRLHGIDQSLDDPFVYLSGLALGEPAPLQVGPDGGQRPLGLDAVGHVVADPEHPRGAALAVERDPPARVQDPHGAVRSNN